MGGCNLHRAKCILQSASCKVHLAYYILQIHLETKFMWYWKKIQRLRYNWVSYQHNEVYFSQIQLNLIFLERIFNKYCDIARKAHEKNWSGVRGTIVHGRGGDPKILGLGGQAMMGVGTPWCGGWSPHPTLFGTALLLKVVIISDRLQFDIFYCQT